jgi:tetratricopeptide (TPR) repeat protein
MIMQTRDSLGLAVSGANAQGLSGLEAAVHQFQCYIGDPVATLAGAAEASPGMAMGHLLNAYLHLLGTEPGLIGTARELRDRAAHLPMNERERGHLAAVSLIIDGRWRAAASTLEDITFAHPRDAIALQAGHIIDFLVGDSRMLRDRIARALPAWDVGMPGYHALLGMHAFGLEESGDYARAEAAGRKGIELEPRDGWSQHAVAHVMEMQGRRRDGITWMRTSPEAWSKESFFAVHNWWHLALYHLDLGEFKRVLDLYDRSIRPKPSTVALEMVDASALLWRLELRGVHVGARWKELADGWAPSVEDGHYAFNDAHAAMAFIGDGRDGALNTLLHTLELRAAGTDTNAMMTREVGLPLTRALQAFAAHDYGRTVDLLLPLRPIAHRFGGSHAQRDLIGLTLIEAAQRGGQWRLARALAAERRALKPASPFNWHLWGRALQSLGDAAGAEQARSTATGVVSQVQRQRSTVAAAA